MAITLGPSIAGDVRSARPLTLATQCVRGSTANVSLNFGDGSSNLVRSRMVRRSADVQPGPGEAKFQRNCNYRGQHRRVLTGTLQPRAQHRNQRVSTRCRDPITDNPRQPVFGLTINVPAGPYHSGQRTRRSLQGCKADAHREFPLQRQRHGAAHRVDDGNLAKSAWCGRRLVTVATANGVVRAVGARAPAGQPEHQSPSDASTDHICVS